MKRIMLLILGAVMLVCFSACKGKETEKTTVPNAASAASVPENTGASAQETLSAPPENYTAKITVQINPVFEIYIDAEGKVLAVNFGNADAREVGKNLSFEELTVQQTIQLLLQASNEKGYFSEEARPVEIQIESSDAGLPDGMSDALRLSTLQTVAEFTDEENVGLELRLKMWDKTIVDTVIKDGKAEDPSAAVTYDPNAQTTSETVKGANGATVIRTYDSRRRLISEKSTIPGFGTVEKIFDGNIVVREILDTETGDHTVTDYWPNGKEKATDHHGADGRILNCEYNENGKLIRSYEAMPGGQAMELEYRDDGTLLRGIDTFPDGTIESSYDEQGNVILQVTDRADDQGRAEYTYNGTTLSSTVIYIQNGGSLEKLVMEYSGATQTHTEYYTNGGKIIRKYDGNGNVISEVFYDAAGNAYDNVDDWSSHMSW